MRRRELITLLGVAAVWPITVRAQQPTMPVVGFLRSTPLNSSTSLVAAFRQGLNESGFKARMSRSNCVLPTIRLIGFRDWWTSWFVAL